MTLFYLGTHLLTWLWNEEFAEVPLFVSNSQLKTRKSAYPRAVTRYAVDSAGYTEETRNGRWLTTPEQYVAQLRRYWAELGPFDFAMQQDRMCAARARDAIEEITGRRPTIAEQQAATVANFLTLRALAPELPIAPVLQGWEAEDYLACADRFAAAGVDLAAEPVVGLGSVAMRGRDPMIDGLLTALAARGITNLHGLGMKGGGLELHGGRFARADSLAWSMTARRDQITLGGCPHRGDCRNCGRWARVWRERVLGVIEASLTVPKQAALF